MALGDGNTLFNELRIGGNIVHKMEQLFRLVLEVSNHRTEAMIRKCHPIGRLAVGRHGGQVCGSIGQVVGLGW